MVIKEVFDLNRKMGIIFSSASAPLFSGFGIVQLL